MRIRTQRGFTLMELMVVVLIVAVLAAVGLPSYFDYVRKSKRTVAKSKLLELSARQEQYFADNKVYADTMAKLGVANAGVDSKGTWVATSSTTSLYTLSVNTPANGLTYTLTADTAGDQTTDDGKCATLTITDTGLRGGTGSLGASCWGD